MVVRATDVQGQWTAFPIQPTLMEEVREAQKGDPRLQKFREQVETGLRSDVRIHSDGAFYFGGRICVPQEKIRQKILAEAHISTYSIQSGGTKMYRNLKQHFWWNAMKRKIAQFATKCLVCQQVKEKHQRTTRLLQPLPIPE